MLERTKKGHVKILISFRDTAAKKNLHFRPRCANHQTAPTVSHFGDNVSRNCTFCNVAGRIPTDESLHLFVECPTTELWAEKFKDEFLGGHVLPDIESKRRFWLLGQLNGENACNIVRVIAILLFHCSVWENKLSKNVPSYRTFMSGYLELLSQTIYSNKKWKNLLELMHPLLYRALASR
jgi:hypothetical protein